MPNIRDAHILILATDGFEERELTIPRDELRKKGARGRTSRKAVCARVYPFAPSADARRRLRSSPRFPWRRVGSGRGDERTPGANGQRLLIHFIAKGEGRLARPQEQFVAIRWRNSSWS